MATKKTAKSVTDVVEEVKTEEKAVEATKEAKEKETKAVPEAAREKVTSEKEVPAKKAPAKKTAAAKAPAKKEPAKTETATVAPAKAASAKKTVKKTECATTLQMQFAGKSYTQEDLEKIAKDVWVYDLNKEGEDLTSLELYVKPEESIVYYVMNKEFTGSFYI